MAKKTVPVRMDDEDKAKWAAAAERDGISFAAWLRNACNAYCEPKEAEPVKAVEPVKAKPSKKAKPESEMTFQELRNRRVGIKEPVSALEAFKHMLPPD